MNPLTVNPLIRCNASILRPGSDKIRGRNPGWGPGPAAASGCGTAARGPGAARTSGSVSSLLWSAGRAAAVSSLPDRLYDEVNESPGTGRELSARARAGSAALSSHGLQRIFARRQSSRVPPGSPLARQPEWQRQGNADGIRPALHREASSLVWRLRRSQVRHRTGPAGTLCADASSQSHVTRGTFGVGPSEY